MAAAKKRAATRRPTPGYDPDGPEARRAAASKRAASQRATNGQLLRITSQTTDLLNDPDTLIDWDDEELRRGYRRNKNGTWPSHAPVVIPRVVYNELWRRTVNTANEKMRESLPEAVDILMGLARSNKVKDADRIKAIGMIMERVLGKVPDKILFAETEAGSKPKWADALDVSIVSAGEDPE